MPAFLRASHYEQKSSSSCKFINFFLLEFSSSRFHKEGVVLFGTYSKFLGRIHSIHASRRCVGNGRYELIILFVFQH